MKTVGDVQVSTDKQAHRGVSLEAQGEKIRAMAVVHDDMGLSNATWLMSAPLLAIPGYVADSVTLSWAGH